MTAVSEIARNISEYAKHGELLLETVQKGQRTGIIMVIASELAARFLDISRVMQDGYSTGKSLGFGLPRAKRTRDEFELVSVEGKGTTVFMRKWGR